MNSLEDEEVGLSEERQNAIFDFRPLFKDNDDEGAKQRKTKRMMLNQSVYPVYVIMLVIIIVATIIIITCK